MNLFTWPGNRLLIRISPPARFRSLTNSNKNLLCIVGQERKARKQTRCVCVLNCCLDRQNSFSCINCFHRFLSWMTKVFHVGKRIFQMENTLWPGHVVSSGSIKVHEFVRGKKCTSMFSLNGVVAVTPSLGRFPASKPKWVFLTSLLAGKYAGCLGLCSLRWGEYVSYLNCCNLRSPTVCNFWVRDGT